MIAHAWQTTTLHYVHMRASCMADHSPFWSNHAGACTTSTVLFCALPFVRRLFVFLLISSSSSGRSGCTCQYQLAPRRTTAVANNVLLLFPMRCCCAYAVFDHSVLLLPVYYIMYTRLQHTMPVGLIGRFKPCMTDISLTIRCAHGRLYSHATVAPGRNPQRWLGIVDSS